MWDRLRPLGVAIEIVITVCFTAIVGAFGVIAAVVVAVVAIPALLVAGAISLIWEVGFVDTLAWTWSILSIGVPAVAWAWMK